MCLPTLPLFTSPPCLVCCAYVCMYVPACLVTCPTCACMALTCLPPYHAFPCLYATAAACLPAHALPVPEHLPTCLPNLYLQTSQHCLTHALQQHARKMVNLLYPTCPLPAPFYLPSLQTFAYLTLCLAFFPKGRTDREGGEREEGLGWDRDGMVDVKSTVHCLL